MTWRVGQHYKIHVYDGDVPVATFHTIANAEHAVRAVNDLDAALAEVERLRAAITSYLTVDDEMAATECSDGGLCLTWNEVGRLRAKTVQLAAALDAVPTEPTGGKE